MDEVRQLKQSDANYDKFIQEQVFDPGFEKDMDRIIDE